MESRTLTPGGPICRNDNIFVIDDKISFLFVSKEI